MRLPLWQITKPTNVHKSLISIPLFDLIQKEFHFDIKAVMGDGIYDTSSTLKYIVKELKAKPRISRKTCNTSNFSNFHFSKSGDPLCQAQLEILNYGSYYDKKQKLILSSANLSSLTSHLNLLSFMKLNNY